VCLHRRQGFGAQVRGRNRSKIPPWGLHMKPASDTALPSTTKNAWTVQESSAAYRTLEALGVSR